MANALDRHWTEVFEERLSHSPEYITPRVSCQALATRSCLSNARAYAGKKKNRNGAERGMWEPVCNPYKRGTAGPSRRGVLPPARGRLPRASRGSFFVTGGGRRGLRRAGGARRERVATAKARVTRGRNASVTQDLTRGSGCGTMGVSSAATPRRPGHAPRPGRNTGAHK